MKQKQSDRVQEITEQLEQGIKDLFESQRYANYLKVMSKLHNYSFNNSMLIAMQRPDATLVAGYSSWQVNFKRQVMKGEQGIKILAPSPYKINKDVEKLDPSTQQPIIGKDGQPVKERIQITIPAYRIATVFDVSQTEGEPVPEISSILTDDVKDYERFLKAIQEVSPVPMEFRAIESGANGYYHLEDKMITVKEGMNQSQTLKTAIHELSHAILHDKDNGVEKDNQLDRRTKEVQAESVSYTVCFHFGLDTSDYSFGYIAGWSSGKELDELKASMNTIRSTSSEIIKDIEEKLVRAEQEEKIENLATEIASFSRDADTCEFTDSVEGVEKLVEDIKAAIKSGNVEYLQKWLQPFSEEKEPADMCEQAKGLLNRINEFSKEKPEHIAGVTASVSEALEMKDVMKYHHRSH